MCTISLKLFIDQKSIFNEKQIFEQAYKITKRFGYSVIFIPIFDLTNKYSQIALKEIVYHMMITTQFLSNYNSVMVVLVLMT